MRAGVKQYVVVTSEDIPAGHRMLDEGYLPKGPLVLEQYLGAPAKAQRIAQRAEQMRASGYSGVEIWRVMRQGEVRGLARRALLGGVLIGALLSWVVASVVPQVMA